MNRIDRLSAILVMLQSSSSVKIKQITERFDISNRTVYRDLKALQEAGIPITGDTRSGYSLVEGFKLPPLMFTTDEAMAFIAAERIVDYFTDKSLHQNYQSGISKIKAVMRLAELHTIEKIDNKIGIFGSHQNDAVKSENVLSILMHHITNHQKLYINYYSSTTTQQVSRRFIEPIGVFFSFQNWYLIAYCHTKKSYRTFRVSRIQKLISTQEKFEPNHPTLDSFIENLTSEKELQLVILEIRKEDIHRIDENRFYQEIIKEEEIDGKIYLHFMVFSLEKFARWYLSYIDIAKIFSPNKLIQEVKHILKNSYLP